MKNFHFSLCTKENDQLVSEITLDLLAVPGSDQYQPMVGAQNTKTGFSMQIKLPRGLYQDLRQKLSQFEIKNAFDFTRRVGKVAKMLSVLVQEEKPESDQPRS